MEELMHGGPKRTVYQPWEMQLLLDFGTCRLRRSARVEALKRYQRLVQQYFLRGQYSFPPLSTFLAEERARRNKLRAAQQAGAPNPDELPALA
jgi:hypothetical protein